MVDSNPYLRPLKSVVSVVSIISVVSVVSCTYNKCIKCSKCNNLCVHFFKARQFPSPICKKAKCKTFLSGQGFAWLTVYTFTSC